MNSINIEIIIIKLKCHSLGLWVLLSPFLLSLTQLPVWSTLWSMKTALSSKLSLQLTIRQCWNKWEIIFHASLAHSLSRFAYREIKWKNWYHSTILNSNFYSLKICCSKMAKKRTQCKYWRLKAYRTQDHGLSDR